MAAPAVHRRRTVIVGAAGRDFHNFNVVYRDDPASVVVAFTAAQIPGIAGRRYPAALAGPQYPDGIPIVAEAALDDLLCEAHVEQVVFAYSDVTHAHVMHLASRVLAAGADFLLLGPARTMLAARLPVIAVSAVRTGCGKSQTARYLSRRLRERGLRAALIRHPMPYGELERQAARPDARVNAPLRRASPWPEPHALSVRASRPLHAVAGLARPRRAAGLERNGSTCSAKAARACATRLAARARISPR